MPKVIIKEGNSYLECVCPVDKCDDCLLRFKCYTSRPLTDLTLAEKRTFLVGQYGTELPRPGKSKYIGSFPLHFEIKLLRLLELDPKKHKILHPFGGKAEFGIRCDIKADVEPDYICDAHDLPFADNTFDCVILDPPYSDELAERLYDTKKYGRLRFRTYTAEAVRVCKEGGYVVVYHRSAAPSLRNTVMVKRILLETRVWHQGRIIHIHKKDTEAWASKKGLT